MTRLALDGLPTDARTLSAARDAGVLVPIVGRADGDSLLFGRRADDLDHHPGQMSFPGGGRD
ncbi:hypothetical protein BRD17_02005 [Halobacteriales archaeon SW_7_68_16]|nr:MAG: hypothetical protein BRD17_02005 [Halobacteriales archaeon SW_7_68_16]